MAAVGLTSERSSVNVRWRPPLAVAIVTHLVTRPVRADLDAAWPACNPTSSTV
jgi:hypothetical protein